MTNDRYFIVFYTFRDQMKQTRYHSEVYRGNSFLCQQSVIQDLRRVDSGLEYTSYAITNIIELSKEDYESWIS